MPDRIRLRIQQTTENELRYARGIRYINAIKFNNKDYVIDLYCTNVQNKNLCNDTLRLIFFCLVHYQQLTSEINYGTTSNDIIA